MNWILLTGALSAFISVAAGAFGAHALKGKLSLEMLNVFEVGARYQMYHALALCIVAIISLYTKDFLLPLAALFFIAGTLLFSGSLYLLALTQIRWLGAITPFGGTLFLLGWLLLAFAATKIKL